MRRILERGVTMKKITLHLISLVALFIGMLYAGGQLYANDAPHDFTSSLTVACANCHPGRGQTLDWMTAATVNDVTAADNQCFQCHQVPRLGATAAGLVQTHSYFQTKGTNSWVMDCKVCHNAHYQRQAMSYPTEGYVVQGVVSVATISTVVVTSPTLTAGAYAGYLVVPNTAYPNFIYRITNNTANTISIQTGTTTGAYGIDPAYAASGSTFAIKYGKMIKEAISTPNSGSMPVKFFGDMGANSFATSSVTINGVCQVCHTATKSYKNDGTLSSGTHVGDANQNPGGQCTYCHTHDNGFKSPAAGCNDCHGNPPLYAQGGPDGLVATAASSTWAVTSATSPTNPGGHGKHSMSLAMKCQVCHSNSQMPFGLDKKIKMGFDVKAANFTNSAWSGANVQSGVFEGSNALANGYSWTGALGTTITTIGNKNNTCRSNYCHGGGATGVAALSGGTNTAPQWVGGSAQATCGTCHGTSKASPPAGGNHGRHAGTAAGQLGLACSDCHGATGSAHVNGQVEWAMNAGNTMIGAGATYKSAASGNSGTLAMAGTYGTCAVICHSSGQNESNGTNAGLVYASATTTWGGGALNCGSCHKDMDTNGAASGSHVKHAQGTYNISCATCHSGYTENSVAIATHVNGSVNTGFTGTATGTIYSEGNSGALGNGYGSCSTSYCHSSSQSSTGTAAITSYGTPTWGTTVMNCGSCHKDMGTDGAATGSHVKHAQGTVNIACGKCHTGYTKTTAALATHVNASINVGFTDGTAYSQNNVSPIGNGYGNCTTSLCHSSGQSSTGLVSPLIYGATVTWGGIGLNCGSCHKNMKTDPAATGSHVKHTFTANIACATCHTGYTETVASVATHANGSVNVGFADSTSYSQGLASPLGNGYGSCSTNSCHSSGQSSTGMSTPLTYGTPTWGNAGNCGYCHQNMDTDTAAYGSHVQHAQGTVLNTACATCHNGYTETTTAAATHIDGKVNLKFTNLDATNLSYSLTLTHNLGSGYGSCSTSSCHGTKSATWGNNTTNHSCTKCHGRGVAVGSYALTDAAPGAAGIGISTGGVSTNSDAKVGAHRAHLEATHGYSAAITCATCHTVPTAFNSAGHVYDGVNDTTFGVSEVIFTGTATVNDRLVGGVPTYAGGTCTNVYCHDSNRFKTGDGGGTGLTPTWANTAYLTGTAAVVCAKCHGNPPPAGHTSVVANDCKGCHSHVNSGGTGFDNPALHSDGIVQGGLCTSCHGNPPTTATYATGTLNSGVVGTALNGSDTGATSPISAGAHYTHNTSLNMGCDSCHANANMSDKKIGIGFKIDGTTVTGFLGSAYTGTFSGWTTVNLHSGYSWTASYPGTVISQVSNTKNTCALYCHGASMPLSNGTNTVPSWVQGSPEATCGTCHGGSSYTTAALTPPSTGAHTKHAGSTNLNVSCDKCHATTTDRSHVNGNVTWSLATGDGRFGASATYKSSATGSTGAPAPSASFNNACNNLYCHSSGQSSTGRAAITSYGSPTWGAAAMTCASCHKDMHTDPAATGSHVKHTFTANIPCAFCHTGYTETTVNVATHANGSINTGFTGTAAGTTYSDGNISPVGNGYGTCSTSFCHSSGQSSTGTSGSLTYGNPAWGGSLVCGSCHKDMDTDTAAATGSHIKHAQGTVNIACANCHTGYTETTVNVATHLNGSVNVGFSGLANATAYSDGNISPLGNGYGNCSTSYCHSSGQSSTGTIGVIAGATTPTWGGAAMGCGSCHKNMDTDANAPGSHVVHAQSAVNYTCNTCHATYSETTAAVATHVNGSVNLSFTGQAAATTYSEGLISPAGNGYGTCSTSLCHGTKSKTWGVTTADAPCVKCHGQAGTSAAAYTATPNTAAPGWNSVGVNTGGTVGAITNNVSADTKVGAHDSHLRAIKGYTNPIACTACHNVNNVGDAGHMDGATTFTWSSVARNAGNNNPDWGTVAITPSYANGNCSSVYCHGGTATAAIRGTGWTSVSWSNAATTYLTGTAGQKNFADCNRCHASPPIASTLYSHASMTITQDCSGCHGHNGSGATHIDGTLYGAGACNSCHSYDSISVDPGAWTTVKQASTYLWNSANAWGAHSKHINVLKTRWGSVITAATDTFGGDAFNHVCGVCHTQNAGVDHNVAGGYTRNINFNGSTAEQFGASAPTWDGVSNRNCSNIDCHFKQTPAW